MAPTTKVLSSNLYYLTGYTIGVAVLTAVVSLLLSYQLITFITLKTLDVILIPRDFKIDVYAE